MKILHITTFTSGGAGIACMRIHNQLRKNGVDSKVLAFDTLLHNEKDIFDYKKLTNNSLYGKLSFRLNQSMQWRYQNELLKGKSKEYDFFSLPYLYNNIRHLEIFKEADIIHLHWIANFINYEELPLFNKKIVWTLHDMNPITGGCHYSYNCDKFSTECTDCPQLYGTKNPDVVKAVFNLKKESYSNSDISFVAPSKWMLQQIRSGEISSSFKSIYIPYGLDIDVFKPYLKTEARNRLNLPLNKKIILYVADNLENRRKGLYLLNKIISDTNSDNIIFCCIGKNDLKIPLDKIHHLGYFKDEHQLALIYSAADLFIIPSVEDNLPNTVLESMACGTPVIGFGSGGIPEMIDNKQNGFIIGRGDIVSMGNKIREIINDDNLLSHLGKNARQKIEDKFNDAIQASKYIELYQSLIKIKILHINTFDTYGGASQVAHDLIQNIDADCTLLVKEKTSKSNKVIQFNHNFLDKFFSGLDKILWKLGLKKSIKNVFSISDQFNFTYQKLKKIKEYREANIIHLHNIHGNYFDLSALKKIATEKYIVWTLHDMWALTGGEAHTFENENYKKGVGITPYKDIYPLQNPLIDRRQHFLEKKKEIYEAISDALTFVTVSRWLNKCLLNAFVFNEKIKAGLNYNGIDTSIFINYKKRNWKTPRLLFFNIKSSFKGSQLFTNIVTRIEEKFELSVVGEPLEVDIPYHYLHYIINNREELNEIFNQVDFLVFPSLAESFGLTVLEAMSSGICVIASDTGGIPEILDDTCGYLFKNGDEEDLLKKINSAMKNFDESRMKAMKASDYAKKFSLETNCNHYLALYRQILGYNNPEIEAKISGEMKIKAGLLNFIEH